MTSLFSENLNPLGYYEAMPKPSVDELSRHYKEKYYQQAQGTYSPDYLPEERQYFHNAAKVARATSLRYGVDASILDLGCGEGFFSKAFHSVGWRVECCDFSNFGITKHNSELLPFFSAGDIYQSIEKYKAAGQEFGVVNLQNVLEHVIDPVGLLQDIKPLFSGTSALRVKIPNDYSDFQLALVSRGDTTNTWFSPPEHLSFFNRQGLSNLLEHCGYEIVSLQADFPIELFLANPHSNYWRDRDLGKGAHLARVFCENYLIETDINAYIDYSEAGAKLGFGRCLTAYAKPV